MHHYSGTTPEFMVRPTWYKGVLNPAPCTLQPRNSSTPKLGAREIRILSYVSAGYYTIAWRGD